MEACAIGPISSRVSQTPLMRASLSACRSTPSAPALLQRGEAQPDAPPTQPCETRVTATLHGRAPPFKGPYNLFQP